MPIPPSPTLSTSFVVVADGLAHKASHCCHAAIATRTYSPPFAEWRVLRGIDGADRAELESGHRPQEKGV